MLIMDCPWFRLHVLNSEMKRGAELSTERPPPPSDVSKHVVQASLLLTCSVETGYLKVFPEKPPLSDHFLITFKFTRMDYTVVSNEFHYSRCLS